MRKLILLAVASAIMIGGCSREIEKVTDSDDLPPSPAAVTDLSLYIGDRMLSLSWQADVDAQLYLIYRADSVAATFALRDSSETNSFTDLSVLNNVRYFYKVSAVSASGIEGPPSAPVSGVPGPFSIRVNDDEEFTNSTGVSVAATYSTGTSHIMLANSPDFAESKWQAAAQSITWVLPDRDDTHTVYAIFKMSDGNESADVLSDDIILDRFALIDNLTCDDGGEVLSAGDKIHFTMVAGETGGHGTVRLPVVGELELFDNGSSGDPVAFDGVYELDYTIPPDVEFEHASVSGEFRDAASNTSPEFVIDHTMTIRNPPGPVTLYLNAVLEDHVDLAWSESGDDDFASYRLYRSESEPVSAASDFIIKISSKVQLSATDTSVVPATKYYYVLIVSDQSGLSATSNTLEITTRDNTAPAPVVLVFERTDQTSFKLTWTKNRDRDFESYRIFRSESPSVSPQTEDLYAILTSQSITSFSGDDGGVDHYYVLVVYDKFGLGSEPSNIVPFGP